MIKIPKFLHNVFTLSFGVLLSQIIGLVFIPVLSRLYSPELYGEFSIFVGISQLFITISTMKYEKALLISEQKDSNIIIMLIIILVFFISLISFILLIMLYFLRVIDILPCYIAMMPFTISSYALVSTILNFNQKKERYKTISIMSFIQTVLIILVSILFGFFHNNLNGLILGRVFSPLIVLFGYLYFNRRAFITSLFNMIYVIKLDEVLVLFRKYIKFPKYYLPYDILFTSLPYLLPMILTQLFSYNAAGYFGMVYRILMVPFVVISSSVANVFIVSANKEYANYGSFSTLYKKTFKKITLIGLAIYMIFFLFGAHAIPILLGPKWSNLDIYIKILSIWMFFEFISVVFKSNTYIIVQKQYIGLILQVLNSFIGVGVLFISSPYGIKMSLMMFSAVMSLFCIVNLLITYRLSTKDLYA